MSEPQPSSALQSYLERAQRLWREQNELPDPDALRAIAERVEMSAEASEAADKRARELTRQAQRSLDDGDADRAESLLRDAVLLSPVRLQPHYLLAEWYQRRYADDGAPDDRRRALQLAQRAQEIDPSHVPTRNLIKRLGDSPQDSLPWKKAALIVFVIALISGSMQLCHRYCVAPEVTDEQTEEVREYFQQHEEPSR